MELAQRPELILIGELAMHIPTHIAWKSKTPKLCSRLLG